MKKILELEALRGGAALYVFFHHTLFSFGLIQKNSFLGIMFSFGQEAVMVFFLLSGYVIAMSMSKRHYGFTEYFKHRFLRIYPIVLIALLVAFIGVVLAGDKLYIRAYDFFINLFMLQDISFLKPGVFANPLFGNSPLWSLSYEWWFYMLFFLHFLVYEKYFKGRFVLFNISAFLISIIGLFTYKFLYNELSLIAMYYYIWFSGAIVLFLLKSNQLNKRYILMIAGTYIIIIVNYFFFFIYHKTVGSVGIHPILELRHFVVSMLGLLFSVSFYKYFHSFFITKYFYNKLIQLFAYISPISFGIYVLHYPIMNYFMKYTEVNGFLLLGITFICVVIVSYFSEIKIYGYIRKKYA